MRKYLEKAVAICNASFVDVLIIEFIFVSQHYNELAEENNDKSHFPTRCAHKCIGYL
jgi:hypothetical protein